METLSTLSVVNEPHLAEEILRSDANWSVTKVVITAVEENLQELIRARKGQPMSDSFVLLQTEALPAK